MTYAVSGAAGHLGRLVADALLERVDPSDVVLLSRDTAKLSAFVDRGAQARVADFRDAATLPGAFAGVDRLLLISMDTEGDRVEHHRTAIDAAAAAGVRWIGYTSTLDPSDSNPTAVAAEHRATEDHLRASGLDWTFLRNSIYVEMLLGPGAAAVASGTLTTNAGTGGSSYVSRADCAAVAAAVMTTDSHANRAYDVTGAEALTADDQAALFAEITGKPVAVAHLTDEEWVATMVEHAGMPEPVARMYATFGEGTRRGYADSISDLVAELTGRPPEAARDVLAAHRDELLGSTS